MCSEELPWRSQANLIQSICHLDVLLGRLPVSHANVQLEPHPQRPNGLTFDAAGVIIDGVLPIHPPMVAGERGGKVNYAMFKSQYLKYAQGTSCASISTIASHVNVQG